ncbi:unnamed protein product, partial [Ixodes persulcatus]
YHSSGCVLELSVYSSLGNHPGLVEGRKLQQTRVHGIHDWNLFSRSRLLKCLLFLVNEVTVKGLANVDAIGIRVGRDWQQQTIFDGLLDGNLFLSHRVSKRLCFSVNKAVLQRHGECECEHRYQLVRPGSLRLLKDLVLLNRVHEGHRTRRRLEHAGFLVDDTGCHCLLEGQGRPLGRTGNPGEGVHNVTKDGLLESQAGTGLRVNDTLSVWVNDALRDELGQGQASSNRHQDPARVGVEETLRHRLRNGDLVALPGLQDTTLGAVYQLQFDGLIEPYASAL